MKPRVLKVGYTIIEQWPSPEALEAGITEMPMPYAGAEVLDVKVTQLPREHRWARESWRFNGSDVVVDMTLAKAIAHDKRRARREKLMEPLDKLATSPNNSIKNKAMTDKQAILDADAPVQVAIDAATTPEQLKQILVNYQAI